MPLYITNVPIRCTINAAIHATIHCPSTTYAAHFAPSSLLIDAIAATHGVYNRLNTRMEAAVADDNTVLILPPNNTPNVDTTLSLAINPLINAVQMRQSPMPSGLNNGTSHPAIIASILSAESFTRFK